jgi:hypothetical protein
MSASSAALWPLDKRLFSRPARDRVRGHLCGAALLWFGRRGNALRPVDPLSRRAIGSWIAEGVSTGARRG